MKPDISHWRDGAAYVYMDELSVEDLAWECLRRNAGYQKDFARHIRTKDSSPDGEDAISRRWGIRFRRPSEPLRPGTAGPLDA